MRVILLKLANVKAKDYILQFIYEHNLIITLILCCIIYLINRSFFIDFFSDPDNKSNTIEMIISLSGTLFGFILTFLSIFLVFKTENKYKKKDNETNTLILFINNPAFNDIYKIFIKCSYFLGLLIVVSIVFYFLGAVNSILLEIITFTFIFLILKSIIYVFLSLYLFNRLINIVTKTPET